MKYEDIKAKNGISSNLTSGLKLHKNWKFQYNRKEPKSENNYDVETIVIHCGRVFLVYNKLNFFNILVFTSCTAEKKRLYFVL